MHSTSDVQCERYSADSDLAASESVPGGKNCSIGGRARLSDCVVVSSLSIEKASSSSVLADVACKLSMVGISGWL